MLLMCQDVRVALSTATEFTLDMSPTARCICCEPTPWGEEWQLGTAAFWVHQALELPTGTGRHRLGSNLREEVAVCMLGGYGVPGPVGNAAFIALRDAGLLESGLEADAAAAAMTAVLADPLDIGAGRLMRYRFHQQRPRRLASALAGLTVWEAEADRFTDLQLRDHLMTLPGVGPKTASWIVRNDRDSDAVAIIDIHIRRAGVTAGVFCVDWNPSRHYERFESAFLGWAAAGAVSAANLDAAIWRLLSTLSRQRQRLLPDWTALPTAYQALFAL